MPVYKMRSNIIKVPNIPLDYEWSTVRFRKEDTNRRAFWAARTTYMYKSYGIFREYDNIKEALEDFNNLWVEV